MVAASSHSKLFDIYHRLIPSSPSSPSYSLSWSLPQSLPWAWEEGQRGSRSSRRRRKNPTARLRTYCAPLQHESPTRQGQQGGEQFLEEGVGILCEPCNGRGWLLCDFCKGLKTNVKAENNRIYRRCPSCRAIGYVLCSKCKVFKCVTFPDYGDGEM